MFIIAKIATKKSTTFHINKDDDIPPININKIVNNFNNKINNLLLVKFFKLLSP